jgi:hypothetical protein
MLRVAMLVVLFSLSACESASQWLAGVGNRDYTWQPLPGSTHHNPMNQDLQECMGQVRGDAYGVDACMRTRGYQKYYGIP